ncbi:hypothetical protein BDR26DRAFT_858879 [Obelidium mucronatum]|nr:hypothetical protein BDR26DRAFT_858879 [Obelidium mucronatum]
MGVRMNIHMLKSTQLISQAILQEMAMLEAEGSISNRCHYLPGEQNNISDAASRKNLTHFRNQFPQNSRPQTTIQQPRKRRTPMPLHRLLSRIKLLTRHHPHITITTTNTEPPDYSYYKLPYHKVDKFGRGSHCYLYSEPDLNESNPKMVFDNYAASRKKMEMPSPDLLLLSNANTPTRAWYLNRYSQNSRGANPCAGRGHNLRTKTRPSPNNHVNQTLDPPSLQSIYCGQTSPRTPTQRPQNQTTTWRSPTLNQIRGQIGPHPAGPSLGQKQSTRPPQTPKSRLTPIFDSLVTSPNLIKIWYSPYQCTCSIHWWGGDNW